MSQAVDLDSFDRKLIAALRENGRMTVTELAQRIGLSKTPCQVRLRREEVGAFSGGQGGFVETAQRRLNIENIQPNRKNCQ